MSIKAIETRYKGYRFRSRTEARWAVFFDEMDIKWEYEVEGYQLRRTPTSKPFYYLPDFLLIDWDTWAEVKGAQEAFSGEDLLKMKLLAGESRKPVVCLAGRPDYRAYEVIGCDYGEQKWANTFLAVITKEPMVGLARNLVKDLFTNEKYVRAINKSRSVRFEK